MLSRAVTGPLVRKICTNPSSRSSRLAMGGLVPRLGKRSSLTLGEYRKSMQTFFETWTVSDWSLPLAPDRADKPGYLVLTRRQKRVDSLRIALLAPLAEAGAR
jgi:hypothetical protein